MLKEKDSAVKKSMMLFDGFVISTAFLLAYVLRDSSLRIFKIHSLLSSEGVSGQKAPLSEYLLVLFLIVPCWCAMLYFNGMYRSMRTKTFLEISWIVLKSSFFTFLSFGTIVFVFRLESMSRLFFAIFAFMSAAFILIEKIVIFSFMHHVRKRGLNYKSLLIVGTGARAANFVKIIRNHPEWGFKIVGAIDDERGRGFETVGGVKIIGGLEDIPQMLHNNAVDEVVFVVPRSRLSFLEQSIHDCELEGVKATIAVDLFDMKLAKTFTTELGGIPLLTFKTTVAKEWQLLVKRLIDMTISGFGIILVSPLLLVIPALIKLTSRGPVFFKQERLGLHGRRFILYKFRTMYQGAQAELSSVYELSDMDRPDFRKKKLGWITPLGRILRKFSFDELPQLFNVVSGQMSLIGPRPTVPVEAEKYKTWQRRRLSMKPGVTCLWQINGRNNAGFEEWMKLDLQYLDNWSLWLDFKILIKTIPVVLFGIGAY